jgi:hypothetical protein
MKQRSYSFLQAIHTTKDNQQMLISQMETLHLLNTIRFSLRKMEKAIPVEAPTPANPYRDALYGKQVIPPEEIARIINDALEGIVPYIFEAFFRSAEINSQANLQSVRDECISLLETILGRRTKLENFKPTNLLSLPVGSIPNEDDEDIPWDQFEQD